MNRMKGQQGLSLIEVTIMLLVLMLLTGVLAPSIFDFVNDAKWVKVKEDCEAIGVTVARMNRDLGPCLKFNGTAPCDEANRVDILYSDGPDVTSGDVVPGPYTNSNITPAAINWDNDSDALVGDHMEDQFDTNAPLYNTPSQNYPAPSYPVGPLYNIGWRGGYLSSPIGPDPWGKRYLVNSVFLGAAVDSTSTTEEGVYNRWWERDVFCISPGPNGLYETYFGGCTTDHGTCRQGDDFIYIIQGSGR
jgi:type II secretory pathway pseudopilin PulG